VSIPLGLLLDIQGAQSLEHGERGIARYLTEHAMALAQASDRVVGLLMNPLLPFPGHLPGALLASRLLRWNTLSSVRELSRGRPVALHLMSPFEWSEKGGAGVPAHLMRPDVPLIATLYDLIPYLMQERYLADRHRRDQYLTRIELVRSADLVLAISEATRADAIRELGIRADRIHTIGGGVSAKFHPAPRPAEATALVSRACAAIRRPYFLSVLGAEPRKNAETLIEAYSQLPHHLRRECHLVITCALPGDWRTRWTDHALRCGCDPGDVVLTGQVPDSVLVALYQAATLFVFPSIYEGFGLPVAEAIACGTPSITSNTSALPEVLDWPPATFDPRDATEISGLMQRAVEDAAFAEELRRVAVRQAPGFRWAAVAERTLSAISETIDRLPRAPRPRTKERRLHLALATPLPPALSGVATYNARIVGELRRHADLDVFFPDWRLRPTDHWEGVRVLPLRSMGGAVDPGNYDAVIYAIGNSEHHAETYEAAMVYPGILWLHDVRLPNLYTFVATGRGVAPDVLIREVLSRHYGTRAPLRPGEDWHPAMIDRFGLGLTPELVQRSRHVIVHSSFARRLITLDQGPDGHMPPVSVIPLAASRLREGGPVARQIPPLVGTLGLVSPRKLPRLLIDAVASTPTSAGLAFIGPCSAEVREPLIEHARLRGIAERVIFTGAVDEDHWWEWIGRLTCVVQLRAATNGESAASLRDAMAHGIPAITNMIGADEEFPTGSLETLPADVDADTLAACITALCSDGDAWQRLSRGAWQYSSSVTVETVVGALLDSVLSTLGV
jgi:glycosyltransferase involved in cell wall biosynthesis